MSLKTKKKWFFLMLPFVILTLVIIAVFIKYWILPASVEAILKSKLKRFWSGSVSIQDIEFNYSGTLQIGSVLLEDGSNKSILLNGISVTAQDGWMKGGKIDAIEIDRVSARIPLNFQKRVHKKAAISDCLNTLKENRLKIDIIECKDIELVVIDKNNKSSELLYRNMGFIASHQNRKWQITLNQMPDVDSGDNFKLQVQIDPSIPDISFLINGTHDVTLHEFDLIKRFADFKTDYSWKGNVSGSIKSQSLRFNGNYPRFFNESTTSLSADLDCKNVSVNKGPSVVFDKMSFKAQVTANRCSITDVVANFCDGQLNGTLTIDHLNESQPQLLGDIIVKRVQLTKLTEVIDFQNTSLHGEISSKYKFSLLTSDSRTLVGKGLVLLRDLEIGLVPSLTQIFNFIGLSQYTPKEKVDLVAEFHNKTTSVILDQAMVSNRLSLVRALKGGKIDFSSKNLDMYVVVLPFKEIDDIFTGIPIVNIFSKLTQKITRLRIRGKWTDPHHKLITKEPLGDVNESAFLIFTEILQKEGRIKDESFESLVGKIANDD